ncbi:unnamed protein product [Oncorhynchus mykiss]|uniref:Intercellular adhesion molecule N-terminal domain-containing protein n=1 Tax=Oncorhynchus mykiss TaxID=8022 RepID=A0A060XT56_ONCMY|nr:unnamed protein product [Oncorhynchus mykiss]
MKDTHTLLNLLLLLVYLAGSAVTTDGGKDSTGGPLELTILGPDFVTVGVPCSFDCTAQCSPSCSYRMSIDGQIGQGNELFFTARQWEESLNLTCTARNDDSGRSSTVSKILQVLGGWGVCWFVFMTHPEVSGAWSLWFLEWSDNSMLYNLRA